MLGTIARIIGEMLEFWQLYYESLVYICFYAICANAHAHINTNTYIGFGDSDIVIFTTWL